MRKYLTIMKTELQRQFAYRYDIASFVPGNMFELFFAYLLWTIIYQSTEFVKGYNYNEMVTYIIIGWIFSFVTATYAYEQNIAKDIRLGHLTNYLLKPISYLKYTCARATGRVGIAIFFVIFQGVIYVSLFNSKLILDISMEKVLILFLMAILAYFIKLFISVITGLLAFWFVDVSGLFFFVQVLVKFFSGAFFPLVLLPLGVYKVSTFLPFMYLFFVPVQYFLNRITFQEALFGIFIQFVWLLILYFVIKVIWKIGLKKYEGYGI